jgi:hypothetical protein
MLIKGREDVKWIEEADPSKPIPEGEKHWFEKVDFHTLGIPFVKRPKSGKRYNFSGYDFEYMIADIKEQSFGKFKTSLDVNRNAHFIGINILHQMFVKNKKSGLEEKLTKKLKQPKKILHLQETLCEFFKEFYESHVKGLMTTEELMDRVMDISEEIYDEKVKEWFLEYCESVVNSKDVFRQTKDRIRKKKAYSAGMNLVVEE